MKNLFNTRVMRLVNDLHQVMETRGGVGALIPQTTFGSCYACSSLIRGQSPRRQGWSTSRQSARLTVEHQRLPASVDIEKLIVFPKLFKMHQEVVSRR